MVRQLVNVLEQSNIRIIKKLDFIIEVSVHQLKKLFLIQLLLGKIVQIDRVRFFAAQIVALRH